MLGIGREVITPEIGGNLFGYSTDVYSECVHDDLTATVYAFAYGEVKSLLISVTVCTVAPAICNELRQLFSDKYGFPFENTIIAPTHTHSGPCLSDIPGWGGIDYDYYNKIFKPAIIKAVETAVSSMEPVLVATATGDSFVGVNRRELSSDNKIIFGQNPWGVHNPKMTFISFKNMEGNVVGNIISYGCHGTSAGRNHEITRDWSGGMIDAVEAVSGGITAFFNGPEGDQGPRLSNGKTVGNIKLTEELGAVAAADALRIYNTLPEYSEASISVTSGVIKLPLLPRIPYEVAKEKVDNAPAKDLVNIAKKTLEYYKSIVESYNNGYVEVESRDVSVSVLRIGQTAFMSSPYELFMEINLRVNKMIPDLDVVILSNANDHGSYFPTESELCRGGYEIECFKFESVQCYTDDADYQFIKEALRILEKLER